jgi:hypothetical protein
MLTEQQVNEMSTYEKILDFGYFLNDFEKDKEKQDQEIILQ